ncbi:MAG: hypothetical protein ACK5PP_13955 [Acidimicrobiales bacterium]
MRRRFGHLLAALPVVVLLVTAAPAPASAADGLSFSRDGSTWTAELSEPLFGPAIRWVPGDARIERFSVRNDSSLDVLLHVDLLDTGLDELLGTGDLRVEVRVGDGAWTGTDTPGGGRLGSERVGPGGVQTVDVRVSMDPAATNVSQVQNLDLRFAVTLTDDPGEVPDPDPDPTPDPDPDPDPGPDRDLGGGLAAPASGTASPPSGSGAGSGTGSGLARTGASGPGVVWAGGAGVVVGALLLVASSARTTRSEVADGPG